MEIFLKFKHRFLCLPLFSKLVIVNILFVFLPILIIIPLTTQKLTELNQKEFSEYSLKTVQQISNGVSKTFNELEQLSNVIITDKTLQEDFKYPKEGYETEKIKKFSAISYKLTMLFDHKKDYVSYLLYGFNGEIFSSGFTVTPYTFDFENYIPLFDAPVYQGPHTRSYTKDNKLVFSILLPVKSFSTFEQLGYMIVDLDYSYFNTLINDVDFSDTIDIMIVDHNQILFSSNSDLISQPLDNNLYSNIYKQSYGSNNSEVNNEEIFYSFYPIDNTDWKVVALHSLSSYNNTTTTITRFMTSITFLTLLCSCLLMILISLSISKPLNKLTKLMSNVQNGDYSVRFQPRYNDEIGKLCNSFNYMLEQTNTLINDVYKLELAEKDATIYALQSQINPHFLYNTLQMVSDFAEIGDTEEVSTICSYLSSIFRYCLNGKSQCTLLDNEINHVQNYIYIQSIQLNHRFKFVLDIPDENYNIPVPRLILQPLVENAITHGIYSKLNDAQITLSCRQVENILEIKIQDNGIGMTKEKLENIKNLLSTSMHTHQFDDICIGLINVHRRLTLTYGEAFGLKINSELNIGTVVSLYLPINNTIP